MARRPSFLPGPNPLERSDTSKSFTQSWFLESPAISSSTLASFDSEDDEEALKCAALEKLPTYDRLRTSVLKTHLKNGEVMHRQVDVRHLGTSERRNVIDNLINVPEEDNDLLLRRVRHRIDSVDVKIPTVEVRFQHLSVNARCYIGDRALPTLWNATRNLIDGLLGLVGLSPTKKIDLSILKDICGIVQPSRMTLLLGPPGSGKTTMLLALAGQLDSNLKVEGEILYNGHRLNEFVPQKTSSYISQCDLHLGEMTVRETLDFSARCQGVGSRYEMLSEVSRREREKEIVPDPDLDIYMKASALGGTKNSLQTDYILKLLGLDICANTIVGDNMIRGVSGGQKKRVTTGEMIVGHTKTFFMDEISTGLDSSTTYQLVKCLGQFAHHMGGTILMSLLQPAPETYELFDDIILLSEGQIVYQGPREYILEFFESCGFKCPDRKGTADFLQEVTSRKDQQQYWCNRQKPYQYISAREFSKKYNQFHVGQRINSLMSIPFDKSKSHKASLAFNKYSVSRIEILKTCFAREVLLIKRNSFVFVFKTTQIVIMALIAMTVFFHTRMHHKNEEDGGYFLGALFFVLIINMFNGYPEIAFILFRLPVFFKQRNLLFYPAWAFTLPTLLTRLPISILESGVWVTMTYYSMGFAPAASRFFKQFLLLFSLHQMSSSLFRLIGGTCRTLVVSGTGGSLTLFLIFLLGGFIIPKSRIPIWWSWGYWLSPLTYAQNAISVNEFLAPEWDQPMSEGTPLGIKVLQVHGIPSEGYWYWLGTGVLLGFSIIFNLLFTIVLAFIKAPGKSQAVISKETLENIQRNEESKQTDYDGALPHSHPRSKNGTNGAVQKLQLSEQVSTPASSFKIAADTTIDFSPKRGMILPFQQLIMSFEDIKYSVDMPREMREQAITDNRLQLLQGITGAFRPSVLTALMGVSGAGKTTLMDVLAGRKTGGYIEGDIRISGFPKRQETFARISGYCEQVDIHSPQVTVYESLLFSAWLRLSPDINAQDKKEFVSEVMELVELDSLKDTLVGIPEMTGLSTEQRKRLTIAVELVANPSIIFMDEPTSGLDARAAAIVMRTVRNTVDTGRTVVCTIHQPSIDIFEAFDELLLMKKGGQVIYAGPLGNRSSKIIEYFQAIPGVPRIQHGHNPATWMLEVTSNSVETHLQIDFATVYLSSDLFKYNKELVKELSKPAPDAQDLEFETLYSQSLLEQTQCCLWKQYLTYWRSPDYNCTRLVFSFICAFLFGTIFWNVGQKGHTEGELLNVMGAMYGAVMFLGINNCSTVQPVVAVERTVFYRERGAGMYSALPYALAHVLIEIPFVFLQTLMYAVIVFSMMNFPWDPAKFFWFFFMMYFTFLYFTYYGMMAVSITPNIEVAAIVASTFYSLFNLFSGFFIPKPRIPGWWIWYYWICPVAWTVYGIVTSQYGNVSDTLDLLDGNTTTVQLYLEHRLGYHYNFLGVVATVLVGFSIFFAFMYAFCIKYLNFQHR